MKHLKTKDVFVMTIIIIATGGLFIVADIEKLKTMGFILVATIIASRVLEFISDYANR